MIIDARLRPPFAGIENSMIFEAEYAKKFAWQFRQQSPASVQQKSMDLLIQEMDKAGITKGFTPVRAGINNQDLVEAIEKYSDRFYGFANIGLEEGAKSISQDVLAEIDRFVIDGPLTGISMEPGFSDKCVDDPLFFNVYEKCEKADIPVMFTSNVFTTEHFAPERLVNVFKTFPKMRMILVHGVMPWAAAACKLAILHPNVYISPDCYMLGSIGHRDYIDAANTVLPNQILFGSAYPLVPLDYAVDYYLHCGLREDVIENVMYNNAMRALGLSDKTTVDVPSASMFGA